MVSRSALLLVVLATVLSVALSYDSLYEGCQGQDFGSGSLPSGYTAEECYSCEWAVEKSSAGAPEVTYCEENKCGCVCSASHSSANSTSLVCAAPVSIPFESLAVVILPVLYTLFR
eukprot:TRINITY_DN4495_c0_g1_i1.p1 TRINITY_DN4495_c0_g1~~TRINITY_DN4495_c0_g1_i1.p1  ORF type:complete len:116 (-),score=18.52 TRINITY_DN4495_c0_g1_i1:115-462(-)